MTDNNSESNNQEQESPKWNWTTKLVVGFLLVALSFWLLVQFQDFIGPLITVFILAYLINPIAKFLQEKVNLPWRLSVTLIYLILLLGLIGLLTWGGFALVEQIQTLIRFFQNNIDQLPELVAEITEQSYEIGPFEFSPAVFDWDEIINEIVRAIQPILGQLGTLAGSLAAGAVNIITWLILIILISYFLLAESEGISSQLLNINIPEYSKDLERISYEIKKIWNSFMRGEILVVFFSLILYTVTLGALQIQFFFGLAAIASIGQLIPYLGAWITWISFGLVALFQTNIPFNLPPGYYMLIVLGVSMVVNGLIDNIIRTKVMAENLKVHPSLVLIGAVVGVQLIGFIGIVIAAPIMATIKLFLNYTIRKLNDQDPWQELELREPVEKPKWLMGIEEKWSQIKAFFNKKWKEIQQSFKSKSEDKNSNSKD